MSQTIKKIAAKLGFETLTTQNNDEGDFRTVAVWEIKAALEAAYLAGQKADPVRMSRGHS